MASPESEDVEFELSESLPSWLTSLVCHLVLLIGMALLSTAGHGMGSDNGIAVTIDPGGSEGAELNESIPNMLLANPAESSPLAAPQPDMASTNLTAPLAEGPDPMPEVQWQNPVSATPPAAVAKTGAGAGQGEGKGDGHGDGEGADGSTGIGIGPVQTKIFGLAAEGVRFVYVFDRSESMNSTLTYTSEGSMVFSVTPLQAAKAELLRSLNDLSPRHRFQIVFYNHMPTVFDPSSAAARLLPADKKNKYRATEFVKSIEGAGGTYHVEALETALGMRPDVIFLLTDGEPKDDPSPYQVNRLTQLNRGRAKINVVQFCLSPREDGTLVQLAKQNGGQHVYFNISRLGPGLPGGADDRQQMQPVPNMKLPSSALP